MGSIGSFGGGAVTVNPSLLTPTVENVTIAASNVEQSYALPANTKSFMVQTRGQGKLLYAYSAGTSGTTYVTLNPHCFRFQSDISSPAITLYFQSPLAGLVVEIESWA